MHSWVIIRLCARGEASYIRTSQSVGFPAVLFLIAFLQYVLNYAADAAWRAVVLLLSVGQWVESGELFHLSTRCRWAITRGRQTISTY
jgi:hypothetical protein